MKIVINVREGEMPFGLSRAAILAMRERGSEIAKQEPIFGEPCRGGDEEWNDYGYEFPRADPDLVAVVEELGEASWGRDAELKVVEIPDGVEWVVMSDEYGVEWIAEKHRTWR